MIARLRKAQEQKDQGFTLIELLVVIIIIGILSAIAIPVFMNQSRKAVDKAAQADVSAIAKQAATYYIDHTEALTLDSTGKSYTLKSGELTGTAGTEGGPIVIPKSNEKFTAAITGANGTDYEVTITYTGGSQGDGATIKYNAASGITGPTKKP